MLHKNVCSCDECCFDKSEQLFQDKMKAWKCSFKPTDCPCNDCTEDDDTPCTNDMDKGCDMTFAMAYIKNQRLNPRTLKTCDDALRSGTLFEELDFPFTGGGCHD